MRRVLALALGLCLFANQALAFGTPTFISGSSNSNNTGSVHSIASASNLTVAANTFTVLFGDVIALNNSADTVIITDPTGTNTWHTYQCPQTAGSLNAGIVSWSPMETGLSAQKITMSDTSTGGTTIGAGGAMFMIAYSITGVATSSQEDTAARVCAGQTGATTTPTATTGAPIGSGELFLSNYISPTTNVAFSYTVDAGHGWTANGGAPSGTSRQTLTQDRETNGASTALTNAPTTTSAGYALMAVALCPTGGCVASGSSSYGGGTTVGVGH